MTTLTEYILVYKSILCSDAQMMNSTYKRLENPVGQHLGHTGQRMIHRAHTKTAIATAILPHLLTALFPSPSGKRCKKNNNKRKLVLALASVLASRGYKWSGVRTEATSCRSCTTRKWCAVFPLWRRECLAPFTLFHAVLSMQNVCEAGHGLKWHVTRERF